VPKAAPAFSALGVLVADYVVDVVRAYVTPLSQVDLERIRTLMSEVLDETRKELEPTGLHGDGIERDLFAQMCYPGQNFDMSVPVPEGPDLGESGLLDLAERFHDQHQSQRGFCFRNQQPLLRGVRLVARGRTPKPERLAQRGTADPAAATVTGTRPAYFGTEFVDTPVHSGPALAPGTEVRGPALIEEPFTVVVVPPGTTARLDELGNYVLQSS
jgi:N-methylhydantoinase A